MTPTSEDDPDQGMAAVVLRSPHIGYLQLNMPHSNNPLRSPQPLRKYPMEKKISPQTGNSVEMWQRSRYSSLHAEGTFDGTPAPLVRLLDGIFDGKFAPLVRFRFGTAMVSLSFSNFVLGMFSTAVFAVCPSQGVPHLHIKEQSFAP